MAPKRQHDEDADVPASKKQRSGFKVGPDNLPDGTWRRKVIKIKKDLIHKAKVKKSYAKLIAREGVPQSSTSKYLQEAADPDHSPEPSQAIHPERQAMLDAPEKDRPSESQAAESLPHGVRRRGPKKPRYFEKEIAVAEKKKAEAEARQAEFERREREKKRKLAERERHRKLMGKARAGGKNGQRKLGLESKVLLEKVKKIVAE